MDSRYLRPVALLALAMLLLPHLAASQQYDLEIGKFMKYCLSENESFTKERIGSSNDYLISVGKFEAGLDTTYTVQGTFVISVNPDNPSNISIVNETGDIEGVLADKYSALNMTYDSLYPAQSELGQALAYIFQFNDSRNPQEAQCRLWTGTDHLPCFDRDSCLKASFSTPMGNQLASGVGWPFVDSVWELTNQTKAIDGNLTAFEKNLAAVEGKIDDVDPVLAEMESELDSVHSSTQIVSQSPLFDVNQYSFCYPIQYNLTSLITAKVLVKRMRDRMAVVTSIPDQAASAVQDGMDRDAICQGNLRASQAEPARRNFWERLTKDERNTMRVFIAGVSPGPLLPLPVRSFELGWE